MRHRGVRGSRELARTDPGWTIRGGRLQLEHPHHLHRPRGLAGQRHGGGVRDWDLLEPRQQGLGRRDLGRGQSGPPVYSGILRQQGELSLSWRDAVCKLILYILPEAGRGLCWNYKHF